MKVFEWVYINVPLLTMCYIHRSMKVGISIVICLMNCSNSVLIEICDLEHDNRNMFVEVY